jgi:hypothetical protein
LGHVIQLARNMDGHMWQGIVHGTRHPW